MSESFLDYEQTPLKERDQKHLNQHRAKKGQATRKVKVWMRRQLPMIIIVGGTVYERR